MPDDGKNRAHQHDRAAGRNNNPKKGTAMAAAVDGRRFFERGRQTQEELPEQEDK
ncbi:hypothetical protein SDC9_210365 [bioreactor metagenome]|uniref:Uncharacterized protein n=1 Tax=bioreactor metagenome TaxID=1076179 RepID=A0A645JTI9_9ZZZZ